MEKPKCRLCGRKHWGNDPCVLDDQPAKKNPAPKKSEPVLVCPLCSSPKTAFVTRSLEGLEAHLAQAHDGGSCEDCPHLADAEKWRNYRDKKAAYMRARRKKK